VWLSWVDPQGYVKRMKGLGKMIDRFFEHVLDGHNERRSYGTYIKKNSRAHNIFPTRK
jgi:hypothetical protein